MRFFYSDSATNEALRQAEDIVYLYGGYLGYNNFGDIIQLKYALDFYTRSKKGTPVIILDTSSIESKNYLLELKKWFCHENFIFLSNEFIDMTEMNLTLIDQVNPASLLHVYGGGFLNKYWGAGIIDKVEDIIEQLGVQEYIFSGQQVDATVLKPLEDQLFKRKPPLLFGVRDRDSVKIMGGSSVVAMLRYSFDDVTEIMHAWKKSSQPNFKQRLIHKIKNKEVMLHINTSGYATANKDLALIKIREIKKRNPLLRMRVAQAYNDYRPVVKDSLQSVTEFQNNFPYPEYKVINLADLSLRINPTTNEYPDIGHVMNNVGLSVASSYHTAMFTLIFGIPSYLMSENDFYSQKRRALGLGDNFDDFLNDPSQYKNNFKEELKSREIWSAELVEVTDKILKHKAQKSLKKINYDKQYTETAVPLQYKE